MTGQPAAGAASAPPTGGASGADEHSERGLALVEQIIAHAMATGLGPNGRLPTERQLAHDLGVTRSSIRYALGILESRGDISREVGRGTYLRAEARPAVPGPGSVPDFSVIDFSAVGPEINLTVPDRDQAGSVATRDGAGTSDSSTDARSRMPGAGLADLFPRPIDSGGADGARPRTGALFAPADVMMVRRLLEPPAMPLAVAWATAADFEEMDRCLAGGDQAGSYDEFEAWDLALHRSIFAATHSPLLQTLYASVEAARHGHIWGDLKRRSASTERRLDYQRDHHQIVAALKARDGTGAVRAMRAHLSRVSDHLNATDPAAGIWP
ncbi:MAG: FCD domain-containing protein [Actinomycetota bacterium]|nr:FCD domain-containing protein [Actinomycetota bacterium]